MQIAATLLQYDQFGGAFWGALNPSYSCVMCVATRDARILLFVWVVDEIPWVVDDTTVCPNRGDRYRRSR